MNGMKMNEHGSRVPSDALDRAKTAEESSASPACSTADNLLAGMREIYEVWAGSEGFKPQTAPEAYQQRLILQMKAADTKPGT